MFRISPLPLADFSPLFDLSNAALVARRARRLIADRTPGFPCRVSLVDAAPGECLILTHFVHQPAESPFHASHAIYVREAAREAAPAVDAVPALLRSRLLSVRGFDDAGMMRSAATQPGAGIEDAIAAAFAEEEVAYVHLHYAGPGCYAARVDRA